MRGQFDPAKAGQGLWLSYNRHDLFFLLLSMSDKNQNCFKRI